MDPLEQKKRWEQFRTEGEMQGKYQQAPSRSSEVWLVMGTTLVGMAVAAGLLLYLVFSHKPDHPENDQIYGMAASAFYSLLKRVTLAGGVLGAMAGVVTILNGRRHQRRLTQFERNRVNEWRDQTGNK